MRLLKGRMLGTVTEFSVEHTSVGLTITVRWNISNSSDSCEKQ
jgi:hypothetical protein